MLKASKAKQKTDKPKKIKDVVVWNAQDLLNKALRKIWMRSMMRTLAIEMACIDKQEPVRKRLYRCAFCGQGFLMQQIDVDHKIELARGADWDQRLAQQTLNIKRIFKTASGPVAELNTGKKDFLENIVAQNLQVLCIECHKCKTKKDSKQAKELDLF